MRSTVVDFLHWWAAPSSNPRFPDRFVRPVRYRRGGGMDNEDALWLIGQSRGASQISILSETEQGGCWRVELACTDPITLLRHHVRFEIVVEGDKIASVVERSEIIEGVPSDQGN